MLDRFRHLARWNDGEAAVEMRLVSLGDQGVSVEISQFRFGEGETNGTDPSDYRDEA